MRLDGPVDVDAEPAHGLRERDAVAVAQALELRLVAHRPGRRRGAEQRPSEPRPLLVGPVHEPDRDGRRAHGRDVAEHLGAGEDVEAAVEPAAVRDGVHVPADQDGAVGRAAQRVPVVAGLVALDLEREVGERVCQPGATARPGLRPRDALGAVLVTRERSQLLQVARRRVPGRAARAEPTRRAVQRCKARPRAWYGLRVAEHACSSVSASRLAVLARRSCGLSTAAIAGSG